MKLKKLAHLACAALMAGTAFCMTFIAGCSNSSYPEAEITISFDNTDYVLYYSLHNNKYPQTVQHFIELTQNGFYDGTIIHNYQANYLHGGGYDYEVDEEVTYEEAYEAASNGDFATARAYYRYASKEDEYAVLADPANGKITPSVYMTIDDGKYVEPLNTLIGEFSSNQHKIDNGALKQTYGCLTMYYTSKNSDTVNNQRVYLDKYGSAFGVQGDYKYNSATSLFRIYTANPQTPSSLSAYCIFGTLNNTDVLDSLKSAISSKSVTSKTVERISIDNNDRFLGPNSNEASYALASTPIIIKTVKITKN